jgi:hypothetical protein
MGPWRSNGGNEMHIIFSYRPRLLRWAMWPMGLLLKLPLISNCGPIRSILLIEATCTKCIPRICHANLVYQSSRSWDFFKTWICTIVVKFLYSSSSQKPGLYLWLFLLCFYFEDDMILYLNTTGWFLPGLAEIDPLDLVKKIFLLNFQYIYCHPLDRAVALHLNRFEPTHPHPRTICAKYGEV